MQVDEHIRAAVVRLNEAIPLGGVEPLYSSSRHLAFLIEKSPRRSPRLRIKFGGIGGQVRAQPKSSKEKRPNRTEFDAWEYGRIADKSNRAHGAVNVCRLRGDANRTHRIVHLTRRGAARSMCD